MLDNLDKAKPGPGTYSSVSVNKKTPGGRFGMKPNSKSTKDLSNIGPGSYNLKSEFSSVKMKKGTFGSSKRSSIGGAATAPGPGMYDKKSKASLTGYSFGSSIRRDPSMTGKGNTPGPG